MAGRLNLKDENPTPDIDDVGSLPPYVLVQYEAICRATSLPPNVQFDDIHQFLILRKRRAVGIGMDLGEGDEGDGDREIRSYRTMDRAVSHFQAGDVQDIKLAEVDTDVKYVTAMVMASMKKTKYRVFICFHNDKAVHAHCQCPIGLAQSCSHVGALLFALNDYSRELAKQSSDVACTSKLSKWNVPRKMTLEPKPLYELSFSRPRPDGEDSKKRALAFDPRHPKQRSLDPDYYLSKMMELRDLFPNTGMSHLAIIPDDAPSYVREEEITTSRNPYDDQIQELIHKPDITAAHLASPIDEGLSLYIEQRTRAQRQSELWKDLHKGRVTSSLFGDVVRAGPRPTSLIQQILGGSSLDRYPSLPKPVQWGMDHEEEALADYLMLQNSVSSVSVTPTGLTLFPSHPFLGASGDGKIEDMSEGPENKHGVLEIKCPYSIKGQVIHDMEVYDIVEKFPGKEFCLEMTEEGPRLRRDHKYYAQVQGEMSIMGCAWCDFVVWTSASRSNCFIERIRFDPEFVSIMLPKLLDFFVTHIVGV